MAVPDVEPRTQEKVLGDPDDLEAFADELERASSPLPQRVNADPEGVERGLAKLVLTLIELLRQLMERQALRRIEAGSLSDEEIERLGRTFMKLDAPYGGIERDLQPEGRGAEPQSGAAGGPDVESPALRDLQHNLLRIAVSPALALFLGSPS